MKLKWTKPGWPEFWAAYCVVMWVVGYFVLKNSYGIHDEPPLMQWVLLLVSPAIMPLLGICWLITKIPPLF